MMAPLARLRRHRLSWALLALPALLLRALIPPGFMPVAAEEGFALEFCPGAAPLPPGIALASAHAHHRHHHSPDGGRDPPSATHHTPCLFAASATLAPAPTAVVLLAPQSPEGDAHPLDLSAGPFVPSILRAQSPRAPPLLRG
jgi:hypothetical protein